MTPVPSFPILLSSGDAVEDAGLRAVEFLIPLTVIFRELNSEFEMRTVKTRVRIDLPTAAPEDALQVRYVLGKKSNTPPPEVSNNEPSIIAVAPHLTHSITSTSKILFK